MPCDFYQILRTDDCYADRLKKLNLLSLEKRRLLADLTFLYKALHGTIDIDVKPYIDFYKETERYLFRHNDKLTLKMRYARTNVFKYSSWEHGTPFPFARQLV